mmetsp:Transcript_56022/g.163701  ORF Transcript_56022/g.163701 Transcript_56022/m.163701 type:complete len:252 (-) Transcript_56022:159-914(-)
MRRLPGHCRDGFRWRRSMPRSRLASRSSTGSRATRRSTSSRAASPRSTAEAAPTRASSPGSTSTAAPRWRPSARRPHWSRLCTSGRPCLISWPGAVLRCGRSLGDSRRRGESWGPSSSWSAKQKTWCRCIGDLTKLLSCKGPAPQVRRRFFTSWKGRCCRRSVRLARKTMLVTWRGLQKGYCGSASRLHPTKKMPKSIRASFSGSQRLLLSSQLYTRTQNCTRNMSGRSLVVRTFPWRFCKSEISRMTSPR